MTTHHYLNIVITLFIAKPGRIFHSSSAYREKESFLPV